MPLDFLVGENGLYSTSRQRHPVLCEMQQADVSHNQKMHKDTCKPINEYLVLSSVNHDRRQHSSKETSGLTHVYYGHINHVISKLLVASKNIPRKLNVSGLSSISEAQRKVFVFFLSLHITNLWHKIYFKSFRLGTGLRFSLERLHLTSTLNKNNEGWNKVCLTKCKTNAMLHLFLL